MKQEQTFLDMVDERMSPAQQVQNQEPAPMMQEEMGEEQMVSEDSEESEDPQVDMPNLYEVVFSEDYDPENLDSEEKMQLMRQAMAADPRVMQMALEAPEKFALFMYGRTFGQV